MSNKASKTWIPTVALVLIAIVVSGATLFYVTTVISDLSELSETMSENLKGLSGTVAEIAEKVGVETFICPVCGAVYPTEQDLAEHIILHGNPIKIGVVQPFTGSGAALGNWVKLAGAMAEEEINAEGGVLGRPIQLIYEDTEGTVEGEVSAMERLYTIHGVDLILGGTYTGLTLAGMDVAAKYEKFYSSVYATGVAIPEKYASDPDKYWSFIMGWANATGYALVSNEWLNYIIDEGIWTPPTYTYAQITEDQDFGRLLADSHRNLLNGQGWTEVASELVAVDTVDFYSVLTKIKDLNPAIVITNGARPPTWAACQKQYVELGLQSLRIEFWNPAQPGYLDMTGDAGEGITYSQAGCFVPGYSLLTADFISRFRALYPDEPEFDQVPGIFYDAVHRLVYMLEKAGTADDIHKIIEAYENNEYVGVVGRYVVDKNHHSIAGADYITNALWQIQDMEQELLFPRVEGSVDYRPQPWLP